MPFKDRQFIDRAMKALNINKVKIAWSDSQKKYPDIWVTLSRPPVITVTQEWARQSAAERRKRLTHELLHIKGLEHGRYGNLVYSTYPAQDTLSKFVYQRLASRSSTDRDVRLTLQGIISKQNPTTQQYIASFEKPLDKTVRELKKLHPSAEVTHRLKEASSIVEKTVRKKEKVYQLQDIAGTRVIFPDMASLMAGIKKTLHKYRRQVIITRNYLFYPKEGYRSFHLIIHQGNKPVEIQLRTRRQDEWSFITHDTFYKHRPELVRQWGEPVVKDLEKYLQQVSDVYAEKDIGVPTRRPRTPKKWLLAGLPVFALNPADRFGLCYELSGRYLMEHPYGYLVHGTVYGIVGKEAKRMKHAWVELPDNMVWEPEHDMLFSTAQFNATYEPQVDARYNAEQMAKMALKYRHWGPWENPLQKTSLELNPTDLQSIEKYRKRGKFTSRALVESRTPREIRNKLQAIFGTYDDLDKMEAGGMRESYPEQVDIADEYMADLERAANDRDYGETNALLKRALKEIAEAKRTTNPILSSNPELSPTSKKIQAAIKDIENLGARSPLDPSSILMHDEDVTVQLWDWNGELHFNIMTFGEQSRGSASRILDKMIAICHKHGVILSGTVEPFGLRRGLSKTKLKQWYKRHGFTVRGDYITKRPNVMLEVRSGHSRYSPIDKIIFLGEREKGKWAGMSLGHEIGHFVKKHKRTYETHRHEIINQELEAWDWAIQKGGVENYDMMRVAAFIATYLVDLPDDLRKILILYTVDPYFKKWYGVPFPYEKVKALAERIYQGED